MRLFFNISHSRKVSDRKFTMEFATVISNIKKQQTTKMTQMTSYSKTTNNKTDRQ